jgi:hypothetical protein
VFLKKILKKDLDVTQLIYTSILYGFSAGKLAAALNNFGVYSNSYYLAHGAELLTSAVLASLLLSPKIYRIFKEKRE